MALAQPLSDASKASRASPLSAIDVQSWHSWSVPAATAPAELLEAGRVLFLPQLSFALESTELPLLSPEVLASSKNASFDPATGNVGGTTLPGEPITRLRALMSRFSDDAQQLLQMLLPEYTGKIERARTSFRPAEISGRDISWRKDDTRLHVDSFPASPTRGKRILRVFSNINPTGRARHWRVGEDFDSVARRFASSLTVPAPGSAALLRLLRVTKSTRSTYDALMLKLHDRMKADEHYQRTVPQTAVEFPAGSTWIVFTDQVSHAAMAGQHQLEQTFLLPVDAMIEPERSPLRVLERIKARPLV